MDNAKPHNSEFNSSQITQLEFKRASHPPYGPDTAASDFFLFGWLESKLARQLLVQIQNDFRAIIEILRNLTFDFVGSIFEGWTERLKQAIHTDGNYI
jgi:hypothetical protein